MQYNSGAAVSDLYKNFVRINTLRYSGYYVNHNPLADWILSGGYEDQGKRDQFSLLYSTRLGRAYADYLLDRRADSKYIDRYDITNIDDPRKLRSVGSTASAYGSVVQTSRNIDKLYK